MKPQTLIMLAVACACGLAAMVLTQKFLTVPEAKVNENLTKVVVASVEIPAGQQITDTMVGLVDLDKTHLPENSVADVKKVVGRAARFPISAREVVTEKKLAAEGISAGLEPVIGEGMRAVSVPITTEGGVAGFIKPDSHVDVMLIVPKNGDNPAMAATILTDVRVLAVNAEMQHDATGNPEHKGQVVENVTMLLTPDNSVKLALAQKNGTLQLMLRNRKETGEMKRSVFSLDDVISGRSGAEGKEEEAPDATLVGENGVADLLGAISGKRKTETQPVPDPEPVQIAQVPRKNLKKLVYRDIQGNPVMEVLVDADSNMGKTLDEYSLLETMVLDEGSTSSETEELPPAGP